MSWMQFGWQCVPKASQIYANYGHDRHESPACRYSRVPGIWGGRHELPTHAKVVCILMPRMKHTVLCMRGDRNQGKRLTYLNLPGSNCTKSTGTTNAADESQKNERSK